MKIFIINLSIKIKEEMSQEIVSKQIYNKEKSLFEKVETQAPFKTEVVVAIAENINDLPSLINAQYGTTDGDVINIEVVQNINLDDVKNSKIIYQGGYDLEKDILLDSIKTMGGVIIEEGVLND